MQLHYALESEKRMTQWSAFTSHTQHHIILYPRHKFTFKIFQQNLPGMSSADQDLMWNWANTQGKCIRQRTVRQETTKY